MPNGAGSCVRQAGSRGDRGSRRRWIGHRLQSGGPRPHSTVASACLDAGITPLILDDLVRGRREFTEGRTFYEGDIADGALIDRIFSEHPEISAVVHCAALIVVPESVADPIGYYEANVSKSLEFVRHLYRNGCDRIIFSSSASIYQAEDGSAVNEDSPLAPQSPYARTKAVCEEMFADIAAAGKMRVLSLRYFNPVGADPELRTGLQLRRPSHALGVLIRAHQEGRPFPITGTNYPTRDGTGIRDYVHVRDLAAAHIAAIERFDSILTGRLERSIAINLGTGSGTTVRELCDAFNRVVSTPLATIDAEAVPGGRHPLRPGLDPGARRAAEGLNPSPLSPSLLPGDRLREGGAFEAEEMLHDGVPLCRATSSGRGASAA